MFFLVGGDFLFGEIFLFQLYPLKHFFSNEKSVKFITRSSALSLYTSNHSIFYIFVSTILFRSLKLNETVFGFLLGITTKVNIIAT